jgi:hypothetical protein
MNGHPEQLSRMEQLPGLPQAAFDKVDCEPDAAFYAYPRFVTHIDDKAIAAVTEAYRELLPPGGAVLDLMSSWVSHVPEEIKYAAVVGQGMNALFGDQPTPPEPAVPRASTRRSSRQE